MNTWQAIVNAGALIALTSCIPAAPGCTQAAPPEAAAPVVLKVKTDKKDYRTKDPIKLTLTAKNTGGSPVHLNFSTGQRFDIVISKGKDSASQTVWKWSKNRMFTQMIDTVTLEPGKTLTYAAAYSPGEKGADGKPLPELAPGTYTVSGLLTTMGRNPRPMTSIRIQIK